jgi:hypothetical protein
MLNCEKIEEEQNQKTGEEKQSVAAKRELLSSRELFLVELLHAASEVSVLLEVLIDYTDEKLKSMQTQRLFLCWIKEDNSTRCDLCGKRFFCLAHFKKKTKMKICVEGGEDRQVCYHCYHHTLNNNSCREVFDIKDMVDRSEHLDEILTTLRGKRSELTKIKMTSAEIDSFWKKTSDEIKRLEEKNSPEERFRAEITARLDLLLCKIDQKSSNTTF